MKEYQVLFTGLFGSCESLNAMALKGWAVKCPVHQEGGSTCGYLLERDRPTEVESLKTEKQ
jgi:hypothetical protein